MLENITNYDWYLLPYSLNSMQFNYETISQAPVNIDDLWRAETGSQYKPNRRELHALSGIGATNGVYIADSTLKEYRLIYDNFDKDVDNQHDIITNGSLFFDRSGQKTLECELVEESIISDTNQFTMSTSNTSNIKKVIFNGKVLEDNQYSQSSNVIIVDSSKSIVRYRNNICKIISISAPDFTTITLEYKDYISILSKATVQDNSFFESIKDYKLELLTDSLDINLSKDYGDTSESKRFPRRMLESIEHNVSIEKNMLSKNPTLADKDLNKFVLLGWNIDSRRMIILDNCQNSGSIGVSMDKNINTSNIEFEFGEYIEIMHDENFDIINRTVI